MAETVENGNYVQVHYTGTFDDNTVFDSSEGKDALEVLAGNGMLIKGFDEALIGMKDGEKKEITIEAKDAYGEPNEMLVQKVPRKELSDEVTPEVGMVLGVKAPTGQVFPATIKEVTDEEIVLDANHPLAGKTLHFKLELVSHREPTEADLAKFAPAPSSCSCGDDDSCDCGDGDSCNHEEEDSCDCGHDHNHK